MATLESGPKNSLVNTKLTIDMDRTLSVQAPVTVFAMILMGVGLVIDKKKEHNEEEQIPSPTLKASLARIDFTGALFLSISVLSILLVLDMGGEKIPWSSPLVFILVGIGILAGALFTITEKSWAKEPIFPLHLLSNSNVVTPYCVSVLQNASQCAVSFACLFSGDHWLTLP